MFNIQPFLIRHFVVDDVVDLVTHTSLKFSSERGDRISIILQKNPVTFNQVCEPILTGTAVDMMFFNQHHHYGTDFLIGDCTDMDDTTICQITQSSFTGHIHQDDKTQPGTMYLSKEIAATLERKSGFMLSIVLMAPLANVTDN